METESDELHVTTLVCPNIVSTNKISINIRELIRDFNQEEVEVGPSRISLKPRRFTPQHLSTLLRVHQVPSSDELSQIIAHDINQKLANDNSLRGPFLVIVIVDFIKERRLILPADVPATPSKGASWEVFERLVKEQRVEPEGLEEDNETDQCSICIEGLSEKIHGNIIEMPQCLHRFHQGCLFEWLGRQNSCPLCRRIPYEEDQETETRRNSA